ncbi:hypothetical protein PGQ11_000584 [Apiospora arundinis]
MNSSVVAPQDNRWDIGMPLPAGTAMPVRKQKKEIYGSVGSGQLADPIALWIAEPENDTQKEAVEDIVQRIAVRVGVTHAWIRSKVHNYGFAYDEAGNRIPVFDNSGVFVEWKFVRKDNHITVDFGHNEGNIAVHGHIYVDADAKGVPTGLMDPGARKYICNSDERILELWKQTDHRNAPGLEGTISRPQPLIGDSERDQPASDRPRWQEEFLMDHYCPCPHSNLPFEVIVAKHCGTQPWTSFVVPNTKFENGQKRRRESFKIKWDWFRAQPQPLRYLELLNESSRGPLGPLQRLFAGIGRLLATLSALVALLNLGVAPEADIHQQDIRDNYGDDRHLRGRGGGALAVASSAHRGTSPRTGIPNGGDRDFQECAIMEGVSPGVAVSRVGAYASRGRHGHGQRHGGCCQEHPGSAGQEQQDEDIPAGLLE